MLKGEYDVQYSPTPSGDKWLNSLTDEQCEAILSGLETEMEKYTGAYRFNKPTETEPMTITASTSTPVVEEEVENKLTDKEILKQLRSNSYVTQKGLIVGKDWCDYLKVADNPLEGTNGPLYIQKETLTELSYLMDLVSGAVEADVAQGKAGWATIQINKIKAGK